MYLDLCLSGAITRTTGPCSCLGSACMGQEEAEILFFILAAVNIIQTQCIGILFAFRMHIRG
jgi:hypothetical protein